MSEEFNAILDSSFNNGTPIWLYTDDYIFGMVPVDASGNRWKEVSYTFAEKDDPLYVTERDANLSFQFLLEEVEKGVSFYVEDLNVLLIKEFTDSLEGKSGPEKINSFISELIHNSSKYSSDLPIVKNKDQLSDLKSRL
ncbi:MAG: hypothetical protein EU531_11805 [Promethearchaeota archaeon]|nr:MAG: hypothetical protein EU531_11805 [Candidatus Lokiarchaeota archaeon]